MTFLAAHVLKINVVKTEMSFFNKVIFVGIFLFWDGTSGQIFIRGTRFLALPQDALLALQRKDKNDCL